MRDERFNTGMPYASNQGYPADAGMGAYDDGQDPQTAGFNKHAMSGGRAAGAANALQAGVQKIGSVFSAGASRVSEALRNSRVARVIVSSDGDDYLGVGEPCRVCGNPVGAGQSRCPHCGTATSPFYKNIPLIIGLAALIILVVVLTMSINACHSDRGTVTPVDPGASAAAPASKDQKKALKEEVSSAEDVVSQQSKQRTLTRYSLYALESAISSAKSVISNKQATADASTAASAQIADALAHLAPVVDEYQWPTYYDLQANLDVCYGLQFAMGGTIQSISSGEGDLMTMTLAVTGDSTTMLYVHYYPKDVSGKAEAMAQCNVYATVENSMNGIPVLFADFVEILPAG